MRAQEIEQKFKDGEEASIQYKPKLELDAGSPTHQTNMRNKRNGHGLGSLQPKRNSKLPDNADSVGMLSNFKKASDSILFPAISNQEFDSEMALNDIKRSSRHMQMLKPPNNAQSHNVSPDQLSPNTSSKTGLRKQPNSLNNTLDVNRKFQQITAFTLDGNKIAYYARDSKANLQNQAKIMMQREFEQKEYPSPGQAKHWKETPNEASMYSIHQSGDSNIQAGSVASLRKKKDDQKK